MLAPSRADDGDAPSMRTKSGQYDDTVFFNDRVSRLSGRSFVASMLTRKKVEPAACENMEPEPRHLGPLVL